MDLSRRHFLVSGTAVAAGGVFTGTADAQAPMQLAQMTGAPAPPPPRPRLAGRRTGADHLHDQRPELTPQLPGRPIEAGLIGVGIACTAGRTFSANSRRLFSAFARGIPP